MSAAFPIALRDLKPSIFKLIVTCVVQHHGLQFKVTAYTDYSRGGILGKRYYGVTSCSRWVGEKFSDSLVKIKTLIAETE